MDSLQQADLNGFVRKYRSVDEAKIRALALSKMMLMSGQKAEAKEWIRIYFRLGSVNEEMV